MTDTRDKTLVDQSTNDRAIVDKYSITEDCSRDEFLAVAKVYARDVVDKHGLSVSVSDLDWEVSDHAKRWAGAVKHRDGEPQTVVLTWEYFVEQGWSAMASNIRHELIHVHLLNVEQDQGHGSAFRRLAEELDTDVRCNRFAEPKWWVTCVDCGTRWVRYRQSKLVIHPEQFKCGECSGDLTIEQNK